MFDINAATILILSLLVLVIAGVHIAIALGISSALGIYLATGDFAVVHKMLGLVAYEGVRDYLFAVIPLFMLMGEFIHKSGAVTDVYQGINRGLRRIPGRLAVATIFGNAIFSFVSGISIASAAAFSRIAYPEMVRFGYNRGFALGAIASSSSLGMLIPPSVLMIIWGILTERSIGQIFLAGVLPGLLLVALFVLYIVVMALLRPQSVGREVGVGSMTSPMLPAENNEESNPYATWTSILGVATVILAVFGGIWFGVFSPTEGAGVGAIIGLLLGILKGMRFSDIIASIYAVGRTSAPILILLITASMYSRTLAMTGVSGAIEGLFIDSGMTPWMIIGIMVLIWFALGMIIDSISILLLTVAIFDPIAVNLGFDPIAFAIMGIIAIEAGMLTPPFGLLVYTVKAAIQDEDDSVSIMQIFKSSTPYWIIMLIAMVAILVFPEIATYLPFMIWSN